MLGSLAGKLQREEKGDDGGDENHGDVDINENGDLGTLGSSGLLYPQTWQLPLMPTAHFLQAELSHKRQRTAWAGVSSLTWRYSNKIRVKI